MVADGQALEQGGIAGGVGPVDERRDVIGAADDRDVVRPLGFGGPDGVAHRRLAEARRSGSARRLRAARPSAGATASKTSVGS